MRALTLSAAVFALLAAGPALAGEPRGGGHHRPPPGPPPAPCCGHGGGSHNVNINVNAQARASAAASATSHLNARTFAVGGFRAGGHGGGTVYVGGGYGGDAGGHGYVGAPVYHDIDRRVLACASAPFGYVVTGFGREGRRPPSCGGDRHDGYDHDRGGRYGYSERHDSYEERSYESYESYEAYEAYEEAAYAGAEHDRRDDRRDYRREDHRDEAYAARQYDRGYMDGRRDCDCRPDGRDGEPYFAPPPSPPVREPQIDTSRPYRPLPPRQIYRQEPGERG